MKKIFLVALFFTSFNLFAQDWNDDDENHHKHERNKYDYFSLGLYGGGHTSNSFNVTIGPANSIAGEVEYRKSKKWGFYLKGIYEFTSQDVRELFEYQTPEDFELTSVKNPKTFIAVVNFGARYYVADGNLSPYFQSGFSHETSYMGDYTYTVSVGGVPFSTFRNKGYFNYYLSANFGVGAKIRLSKKFSVDMQYDVYQYVGKYDYHNGGYSALIGLKYNF